MPAAGFVARTAGASARPFPSFPTSHVNDAVSPASRTPSPSVSVIVARERRSEAAVIGMSTSNVSARAASRATSRRRAMPGAFGMASAWARSVSGSVSWAPAASDPTTAVPLSTATGPLTTFTSRVSGPLLAACPVFFTTPARRNVSPAPIFPSPSPTNASDGARPIAAKCAGASAVTSSESRRAARRRA